MKQSAENLSKENSSNFTESLKIGAKDELLIQTFARVDGLALGAALAVLFGGMIFCGTNFLIFKGGESVGPTLALINQYFVGYSVTYAGSFIGLIYGAGTGFALGWLIALLRNTALKIYLYFLKFKGRINSIGNFLDN